jgi:hypothetical protein
MKTIFIFFALCLVYQVKILSGQGISINNDGIPPDNSAMLDVNSGNKGLLIPRMSTADRLSILNPANGLMVFDITTGNFNYMNTTWKEMIYNGFPDLGVGHLNTTSINLDGPLELTGINAQIKFDDYDNNIILLDNAGYHTIYFSNTNNKWEWRYLNSTTAFINIQTGNFFAPRMYDLSNYSYYVDPAATCYLKNACFDGNVGIGTSAPNGGLEVALSGSGGTILASDGGGSERYVLKLASPYDVKQYSLIESTKYGTNSGGRELQINTLGGGQTTFGGAVIPLTHFSQDLGLSSQAWDDVYADDFQNITVMCFNNRQVSGEILNFKPAPLEQSLESDYLLDASLLPPGLSTNNAVNLGNIAIYNYTLNYEQQLQINELKKENKELRVLINELLEQRNNLK